MTCSLLVGAVPSLVLLSHILYRHIGHTPDPYNDVYTMRGHFRAVTRATSLDARAVPIPAAIILEDVFGCAHVLTMTVR